MGTLTNGFYNSNKLSKEDKRNFLEDAIKLCYRLSCESKYTTGGISDNTRNIDPRLNLSDVIEHLLESKDGKLDCIDRFAYDRGIIDKELCEYEICFHTCYGFNSGWLLLYIFVNEENFYKLVEKYNLSLIEW